MVGTGPDEWSDWSWYKGGQPSQVKTFFHLEPNLSIQKTGLKDNCVVWGEGE